MTCPHPEKHAHRTKAATLAARDHLEQARGIDLALRAYRCICGAWHLGHPRRDPAWARGLRKATR